MSEHWWDDFPPDEDGFRYPNARMHKHFDGQLRNLLSQGYGILEKRLFTFMDGNGDITKVSNDEFEFYILSAPALLDYNLECTMEHGELFYRLERKRTSIGLPKLIMPNRFEGRTCDECGYITDWLTYVPTKNNFKGYWQLCRTCRQKCPLCLRFFFIGDGGLTKHVTGECRYMPVQKLTKSL